ncbi:hypothetical protein PFISCL1PPCAC_22254, partial [Pristionchus fissidentatus]
LDKLPFEVFSMITSNLSGDDLRDLRRSCWRFSRWVKPTIDSFPAKIRSKIFSYLTIGDRKTLRLVSRSMEEEVSLCDLRLPSNMSAVIKFGICCRIYLKIEEQATEKVIVKLVEEENTFTEAFRKITRIFNRVHLETLGVAFLPILLDQMTGSYVFVSSPMCLDLSDIMIELDPTKFSCQYTECNVH